VLFLLGGPTITGAFANLPLPLLFVSAVVFGTTWLITSLAIRLKLSGFLFGR
jgi:hypothetical protein